jgi:hypothetical protein
VQCSAVQCSAVQCSAVQCSAVQSSAVVGWSRCVTQAATGHGWRRSGADSTVTTTGVTCPLLPVIRPHCRYLCGTSSLKPELASSAASCKGSSASGHGGEEESHHLLDPGAAGDDHLVATFVDHAHADLALVALLPDAPYEVPGGQLYNFTQVSRSHKPYLQWEQKVGCLR